VRPFNGTGLMFVESPLNVTSRQNAQSFVNPFDVSSRTALPRVFLLPPTQPDATFRACCFRHGWRFARTG
jgi:hypothetical protein